jgi:hypothetical protein
MGLKSTFDLTDSVLSYTCADADDAASTFTRSVDLGKLSAGVISSAIAFAIRTALRNSTGGRDIEEAEGAVDARLTAWANGEWGAERGGASGEAAPFSPGNILAKAVARVYASKFADAGAAAAALSEMLEKQLAAASKPAFSDLDEEAQRKVRNLFSKAAREKDALVDAAVATITAEQAAARAAKKAGASAGASTGGLF